MVQRAGPGGQNEPLIVIIALSGRKLYSPPFWPKKQFQKILEHDLGVT